jgi:hypothetical protein
VSILELVPLEVFLIRLPSGSPRRRRNFAATSPSSSTPPLFLPPGGRKKKRREWCFARRFGSC